MVTVKRENFDHRQLRCQRRGRQSRNGARKSEAYGRAGEQSRAFASFSGVPYAIRSRIV